MPLEPPPTTSTFATREDLGKFLRGWSESQGYEVRVVRSNRRSNTIQFCCKKGGNRYVSRSVGLRAPHTIKTDCPFGLKAKVYAGDDRYRLVVTNPNHNHEAKPPIAQQGGGGSGGAKALEGGVLAVANDEDDEDEKVIDEASILMSGALPDMAALAAATRASLSTRTPTMQANLADATNVPDAMTSTALHPPIPPGPVPPFPRVMGPDLADTDSTLQYLPNPHPRPPGKRTPKGQTRQPRPEMIPEDDIFELYDLRVEVACPPGQRILCGARNGDFFVMRGEMVHFPPGQGVSIYTLSSVLPLLPAKQRMTHANDWMSCDDRVACPDPNCPSYLKIVRTGLRRFSKAKTTVVNQSAAAKNSPGPA